MSTLAQLPPAPENHVNVFVDGAHLVVPRSSTVMQACTQAAKEIPHFCYHERLSVAGNCRMCLVEIEGMPKPVASCHWPVAEGMRIRTDSQVTLNARKGTMELLLINHPLDCPICDQGGECDLQDQAVAYGADRSHFGELKRAVDDKEIGSKIKTVMTRCIHCTRCVRFATEIAGVEEFGATGRGENMQVGTYVEQALQSELAGNMIDLCPVGALTSKPYAYTARPWELARTASLDILDATGTPIWVDTRAGKVMRVLPQENAELNEEWLTDAARFSYDALGLYRLTTPLLKGKPVGWPEAFAALKKMVAKAEGKIGGVLGTMAGAEEAYSFRRFLAETLGSTQYAALPVGGPALPATFSVPFTAFDQADAVLLLGCNPRRELPLLNVRLRRGVLKRGLQVLNIGAAADLTYAHTHLGETAAALEAAKKQLKGKENVLILAGAQLLARTDAPAILAQAAKLGPVNVLHASCGTITALQVGAHAAELSEVVKRWQSGKLNLLWVHGDDTVTAANLAKRTKGEGAIVYLGTHATALAHTATLCLPMAAWSEQAALFSNAEGRVQEALAAVAPPLHAKEGWKIYRAVSEELGAALPWNSLAQLRTALASEHPAFAPELRGQPQAAPWQWPKTSEKPLAKKFTEAVPQYYLRHTYLQHSSWMHKMQAETGSAALGHQPGQG